MSTPDDRESRVVDPSVATSTIDQSLAEPAVDPGAFSQFGAATAAACHGSVTCPGYACTGSWSSPRPCGVKRCAVYCGPPEHGIIAALQPQEVYRPCFDVNGQFACTEWAQTLAQKLCGDPLCNDPIE